MTATLTITHATSESGQQPAHATSALLTKLLASSGRHAGSVIARRASRASRLNGRITARSAGGVESTRSPGKVLSSSFFIPWQVWSWDSQFPYNNSHTELRVDFGITWRWELMANPASRIVFCVSRGREGAGRHGEVWARPRPSVRMAGVRPRRSRSRTGAGARPSTSRCRWATAGGLSCGSGSPGKRPIRCGGRSN
jgi:hypothetical protein